MGLLWQLIKKRYPDVKAEEVAAYLFPLCIHLYDDVPGGSCTA
jgi:hypothetical protein